MQAVWPGMVVDEKNLTVQISTFRRALDDGRTDRSCIQTEAGRGYRIVVPVTRLSHDEADISRLLLSDKDVPVPGASLSDVGVSGNLRRLQHRPWMWAGFALAVLVLASGLGSAWLFTGRPQSVIDAAAGAGQSTAWYRRCASRAGTSILTVPIGRWPPPMARALRPTTRWCHGCTSGRSVRLQANLKSV